jgi:hypothetical protein
MELGKLMSAADPIDSVDSSLTEWRTRLLPGSTIVAQAPSAIT